MLLLSTVASRNEQPIAVSSGVRFLHSSCDNHLESYSTKRGSHFLSLHFRIVKSPFPCRLAATTAAAEMLRNKEREGRNAQCTEASKRNSPLFEVLNFLPFYDRLILRCDGAAASELTCAQL